MVYHWIKQSCEVESGLSCTADSMTHKGPITSGVHSQLNLLPQIQSSRTKECQNFKEAQKCVTGSAMSRIYISLIDTKNSLKLNTHWIFIYNLFILTNFKINYQSLSNIDVSNEASFFSFYWTKILKITINCTVLNHLK